MMIFFSKPIGIMIIVTLVLSSVLLVMDIAALIKARKYKTEYKTQECKELKGKPTINAVKLSKEGDGSDEDNVSM